MRNDGVRKLLLLAVALVALASTAVEAGVQAAEDEREREAVRKVVETYLYAEHVEEKQRTHTPGAMIIAVDTDGKRTRETRIDTPARKMPKGAKISRSPQRVVAVDVFADGASVKVATDFAPDAPTPPEAVARQHFQYVSLLKLGGEWKIVSILMPSAAAAQQKSAAK